MRQNLIKIINLSLFLFICTLTFAYTKNDIDLVLLKYQNSAYFQIKIEQENYFEAQKTSLKSYGTLYRENNDFLIVFDKPHHQFIKFSNNTIVMYDSSIKTAYQVSSDQFPNFNPLSIFAKNASLKYTLKSKDNPFDIVIPSLSEYIDFLTIDFDFKRTLIKSISYKDNLNNKVLLKFKQNTFSEKSAIKIPQYSYPAGTKIVKP